MCLLCLRATSERWLLSFIEDRVAAPRVALTMLANRRSFGVAAAWADWGDDATRAAETSRAAAKRRREGAWLVLLETPVAITPPRSLGVPSPEARGLRSFGSSAAFLSRGSGPVLCAPPFPAVSPFGTVDPSAFDIGKTRGDLERMGVLNRAFR